jgi:hypothetical protein
MKNNEYSFEFDEINIGSVFGDLKKNQILFGGKYSLLTLLWLFVTKVENELEILIIRLG